MPFTKNIICLANSQKLSCYCFAGKEFDNNKWVRPVSEQKTGELTYNEMCFSNGQIPKLLDIVTISLLEHTPQYYQTENYLINNRKKWIKVAEFQKCALSMLCDKVDSLWINGCSSRCGLNDRISKSIVEEKINSSLLFVQPEKLSIHVKNEYSKIKVRAHFTFNEKKYWLIVTDPLIKKKYLEKGNGEYNIYKHDVYLCVSLGGIFEGFSYKLVAGIINLK